MKTRTIKEKDFEIDYIIENHSFDYQGQYGAKTHNDPRETILVERVSILFAYNEEMIDVTNNPEMVKFANGIIESYMTEKGRD